MPKGKSNFPENVAVELLIECHRRCCICHRFCGIKMEIDHIIPRADGGPDTKDNGIPVCFECHAEIHSYNDKHPRGRKFRPKELKGHKKQWIGICSKKPQALLAVHRNSDVGPVQAMIDELEFNSAICAQVGSGSGVGHFHDEQFRRGIREGAIAILDSSLKDAILSAYAAISAANVEILKDVSAAGASHENHFEEGASAVSSAHEKINFAKDKLIEFLGSSEA